MALYLHQFNLIVLKESVIQKYDGGLNSFRKDYEISTSEINQEDDRLFSLCQMNPEGFDIAKLTEKGLEFDEARQHSDDFVILGRYFDNFWKVKWIQENKVFAWHVDAGPEELQMIERISNMSIDELAECADKGKNLLGAIHSVNLASGFFHLKKFCDCHRIQSQILPMHYPSPG